MTQSSTQNPAQHLTRAEDLGEHVATLEYAFWKSYILVLVLIAFFVAIIIAAVPALRAFSPAAITMVIAGIALLVTFWGCKALPVRLYRGGIQGHSLSGINQLYARWEDIAACHPIRVATITCVLLQSKEQVHAGRPEENYLCYIAPDFLDYDTLKNTLAQTAGPHHPLYQYIEEKKRSGFGRDESR